MFRSLNFYCSRIIVTREVCNPSLTTGNCILQHLGASHNIFHVVFFMSEVLKRGPQVQKKREEKKLHTYIYATVFPIPHK